MLVLQGNGLFEAGELPQLPANARYTYHENKCYDWGTFGWAMDSGKVDTSQYKYIIFMNSSVRGPFLPPYWPVRPCCRKPSAGFSDGDAFGDKHARPTLKSVDY